MRLGPSKNLKLIHQPGFTAFCSQVKSFLLPSKQLGNSCQFREGSKVPLLQSRAHLQRREIVNPIKSTRKLFLLQLGLTSTCQARQLNSNWVAEEAALHSGILRSSSSREEKGSVVNSE